MINIISVPHTGTHFLYHLFRSHSLRCRILGHYSELRGYDFYHEGIFVSPIRDPIKQYITWKSHNTPIDCFEAWWELNNAYRIGKITVLPIDSADREIRLAEFSDLIEKQLKTDWEPKNSRAHKGGIMLDDRNLNKVYGLSVVKNHYTNPFTHHGRF